MCAIEFSPDQEFLYTSLEFPRTRPEYACWEKMHAFLLILDFSLNFFQKVVQKQGNHYRTNGSGPKIPSNDATKNLQICAFPRR